MTLASRCSLETSKWRTLPEGGSYARYVPPGHIVYARAGSLMAVPFDLSRMEVTGSPVPVQGGLGSPPRPPVEAPNMTSRRSRIACLRPRGRARPPAGSLMWVDRTGVAKALPAPPRVSAC